jgi:hypothetical protein
MAGRLLIAAGGVAADPDRLPAGIRALIDAADDVVVIAPRLPGRLEWISSDTDKATAHADERLAAVLGHMEELDKPARGEVGADDPLVAFEDAVRKFEPDHILIALRPEDRAGWQERGLLDRVGERFGLPLTVFTLPDR